jgi:hypothetical protein
MTNNKSAGAAQMEQLAAAPSGWRILNLHRAMREGVPAGFFSSKRLSNAIILKHTLRSHERSVFDAPPIVATKVLVPLDQTSLSAGAISFFVGERSYSAIMRQAFGINVADERDRDACILGRLSEAPSLDLFLLRELLAGPALAIPPKIFEVSLVDDTAIRAYITRELTPLIRIAVDDADTARISRFVDSIFGSEIGTQAADFFQSLALAEDSWPSVIFAWKAALFYESHFPAMQARLGQMCDALNRLKTHGHSEAFPRSTVDRLLEELRGLAARSQQTCMERARLFNSTKRASIIESGNLAELAAYLRALPESVLGFGGVRAVMDHILSYWQYRTQGLDGTNMHAETFCGIASDICAIGRQFAAHDAEAPRKRA